MNIFELAEIELIREGQEVSEVLLLERAITIRKWLDKHREATGRAILKGGKVYQYGNRVIVSKR